MEDRVWALDGESMHYVLAKAADARYIVEERLYAKLDGWDISGQPDAMMIKDGILSDYKRTSVWNIIMGTGLPEWEKQLNIYAWLFMVNGIHIERLEAVVFCRDWRKSENRAREDYPKKVNTFPIKKWSIEKTEAFIGKRLLAHEEVLPLCTPDERWAKPDKWAAMNDGAKRATKLFDNPDDAALYVNNFERPMTVVHRQGDQWTRCRDYCSVAPKCSQYLEGSMRREGAPTP